MSAIKGQKQEPDSQAKVKKTVERAQCLFLYLSPNLENEQFWSQAVFVQLLCEVLVAVVFAMKCVLLRGQGPAVTSPNIRILLVGTPPQPWSVFCSEVRSLIPHSRS